MSHKTDFWGRIIPKRILIFCRRNDPADFIFAEGHSPDGDYLFNDGTIGRIHNPDFEIEEFLDEGMTENDLDLNGKRPIGNLYIDRWALNGKYYQGGCFLYYEGERMKDYCDRNKEPYPVKRIPEKIIDAIECDDHSIFDMT